MAISPSCIFMIKICFSFVAESILFISGVSGNFPCSFLVLIALLKNGQLCISKVSHFLNNKLSFYIYSNILCLFYIPKLPINKPKKKKNPFIFKLFWDSFLGGQLKLLFCSCCFLLKEEVNWHTDSFIDCQCI